MKQPLVSIVVITYNSSSFIEDGLESIKNQTYRNIEIIISDDCSTDNTVEICKRWLEKNKMYFRRSKLVTSNHNTGVAGNLNRGFTEAIGEWVKTLSGDDKFLPCTIDEYVKFIQSNPSAEIICGKFKIYGDNQELVKFHNIFYEKYDYPKINLDQKKQYRENLKGLFVPGPGLLYKKALWEELNGFDDRYPFCEEDPFMFKLYKSKRKVYFLDKEVYCYQIRSNSLGREKDGKIINRYQTGSIQFYKDERRQEMLRNCLVFHVFEEDIKYKILEASKNKQVFLYYFYKLCHLFSPVRYTSFIKYKYRYRGLKSSPNI